MKKPSFLTEEEIKVRLPRSEQFLVKAKADFDRARNDLRYAQNQIKWYKRTLKRWQEYNARTRQDSRTD